MSDEKKKHLDWAEIEDEYITGNLSYRGIAEKFGTNIRTVSNKARADGWVTKRKEHRKKRQEAAQQAAIDVAVNNIKSLENVTTKAVSALDKYFSGDIFYDPKEFKTLTGAIKDLASVTGELRQLCSSGKQDKIDIQVTLPEGFNDYAE